MYRYFDFFELYANDLKNLVGKDHSKEINSTRKLIISDPDIALSRSRKIIETSLKKIMRSKGAVVSNSDKLIDLIDWFKVRKEFSESILSKLHQIRKAGNNALHSDVVDLDEAFEALRNLDRFFRYLIEKYIDSDYISTIDIEGTVFIQEEDEEIQELQTKLNLVDIDAQEKEAAERLIKDAKKQTDDFNEKAISIETDMKKVRDEFSEFLKNKGIDIESDEAVEQTEKITTQYFEQKTEKIKEKKAELETEVKVVSEKVMEILSENDWINKALTGGGNATTSQLRAIENKQEFVQVRGCAGSGKTLCLIAKAMKNVDESTDLFASENKAIIVCFNPTLRQYSQNIVNNACYNNKIEVVSIDKYMYDLMKKYYPKLSICYSIGTWKTKQLGRLDYVKQAIANLKANHEKSNNRFLNQFNEEIVKFLEDEFTFIESRVEIEGVTKADKDTYLEVQRTGRGGKIIPTKDDRAIIFDIFAQFRALLRENNRYSINDAYRWLYEKNDLPKYAFIGIDESQDLDLIAIRFLLKLKQENSGANATQVVIVGDENQKIYRKDFTWKQLGVRMTKANTETLPDNMRNSKAIADFAGRLINDDTPNETINSKESSSDTVQIIEANVQNFARFALDGVKNNDSILMVVNAHDRKTKSELKTCLITLGITPIEILKGKFSGVERGKIYLSNRYQIKGLEFDEVIVPAFNFDSEYETDKENQNNLTYVSFSRAREKLIIGYQGKKHQILDEYYKDYFMDIELLD